MLGQGDLYSLIFRPTTTALRPTPPVSNVYVYMISALPPVFTLIGFSTLIFVQPRPPPLGSNPPPLFHVSIVLLSLNPALSTVFILTYLSTRSIVHVIPLIVT